MLVDGCVLCEAHSTFKTIAGTNEIWSRVGTVHFSSLKPTCSTANWESRNRRVSHSSWPATPSCRSRERDRTCGPRTCIWRPRTLKAVERSLRDPCSPSSPASLWLRPTFFTGELWSLQLNAEKSLKSMFSMTLCLNVLKQAIYSDIEMPTRSDTVLYILWLCLDRVWNVTENRDMYAKL